MPIEDSPTLELVGAHGPKPRNLELEAAKACLVAAFHRRLKDLHPGDLPSQRELGEEIGLSQPVVNALLNEQPSDMQLSSLLQLQRWIGRPLDEILGIARAGDPTPLRTMTRAKR